MCQRLPPSVQDREAADLRPEPSRIGGQRGHGLNGGLEQDRIDGGLVLEGDGGDRWRQGEHDVEIGDRQQFGPVDPPTIVFAPRPDTSDNADCGR